MTRRWIAPTTIGDLVDRRAAEHPGEEAVVFPEGRATFAELAARAEVQARRLLALGVGPGDRVGTLLPASVDLVALLVGAAKIGAIAVPVNARFKAVELRQIVLHSGMKVVVTDAEALVREAIAEGAPELEHVVSPSEPVDLAPVEAVEALQASVKVRDTAVLVYTSGTTAAPKGAKLSHEALTRLAAGIGERMALTPQDRLWTAIPLFHGGGISFLLTCLTARTAFVHAGYFDPGSRWRR